MQITFLSPSNFTNYQPALMEKSISYNEIKMASN